MILIKTQQAEVEEGGKNVLNLSFENNIQNKALKNHFILILYAQYLRSVSLY